MSFADITVVGITGADSYTEGTMYAVARSCAELPGSRGLLISPSCPQGLPENIRHQPCRPFGYLEYNLFVLYQLMYYIDTDYCLIVQNDGWVLNGQNWQDAYREYDYIGAPLPILLETEADGQFFLKGTDQYLAKQHLIQTSPNLDEPQNGGFSLRSRRTAFAAGRRKNCRYGMAGASAPRGYVFDGATPLYIAGLGFEIRASKYCYAIFFRSTVYQSNEECPFRARLWGALDGKCGLDRLQPYPFYPIKW